MGIQASDIAVNATQIFDVVFSEIYRARGGQGRCGRDGGFAASAAITGVVRPVRSSAIFVGHLRGYVPKSDERAIPQTLEGGAHDGSRFVFQRTGDLAHKGPVLVANYRVMMVVPSVGAGRRIAAFSKMQTTCPAATAVVEARLIKVPKQTLHRIMNELYFQTYWRLRDKFTAGMRKTSPEHWQALQRAIKHHGLKIPAGTAGITGDKQDITVFHVPFSTEGMPDSYTRTVPTADKIRVGVCWTPRYKKGEGLALWWNQKTTLLINMCEVPEFTRFPDPRLHPDAVDYLLRHVQESVEHELRHAVQFLMLKQRDPNQTKINPGYEEHRDDYWTSPVEFDPQIGSQAFEFVEFYNVHLEHGKVKSDRDLYTMIKIFTGGQPPKSKIGGFQPSSFFLALRRKDPSRWRTAVKKFVTEVEDRLTNPNRVEAAKRRRLADFPKDRYGLPILVDIKGTESRSKFSLAPDAVAILRHSFYNDRNDAAFRKYYGHDFAEYASAFWTGFVWGYKNKKSDFEFLQVDREEMEANGPNFDEAASFAADGAAEGMNLRDAHEWFLAWGQWDEPNVKVLQKL